MEKPMVGVAVIIVKDGKVLIERRRNSHGDGTYCVPGGHLEMGEEINECIEREIMEETSLKIDNIRLLTLTNDIFSPYKHYITLFYLADYVSGKATIMEPDKCDFLEWMNFEDIPEPLFLPHINLKKQNINLKDYI